MLIALAGFGVMLLPSSVVVEPWGICILVLSLPWCGWLCWIGFRRWDLLVRIAITIVGVFGFSFANILSGGVIAGWMLI